MSLPWYQPEKWKGIKATPLPTRSVTSALTLVCEPFSAPDTQTQAPSLMPRSAASLVLISTNISCCSSASQGFERVSSPPPSYSTRRPEVRINGYFLCISSFTAFCCTDLKSVGRRQKTFTSLCVGYFSTRSEPGE